MRRFYKDASVAVQDNGFAIMLDAKPVRTPARGTLTVPTRELADAVADEWRAQGDKIDPATMPLTGLANAAIDHVAPDPAAFAAPLVAYAETDLLCYRADHDRVLAARQVTEWNPWLAWAEARYGVEFVLAAGIMHVAQPAATVTALSDAVHALSPFTLAALAPLVTISGSLVLGLAVLDDPARAEAIWPVSVAEALHQESLWGTDAAAEAQRAAHRHDFMTAAHFAALLA